MTDRVTLILGEDRIEVLRLDLISKSQYFAALLSPNFKDSQNIEHRINYDIHINTLLNFVLWASEPEPSVIDNRPCVKPSLAKYVENVANFDELWQLLQLSVLFVVDTLVKDLTDLVVRHWMTPQKCVQIWLLARELGLTVLRDIAKATCIDRLQDVPETSLLELPEKDFIELIGNASIRVSRTSPREVFNLWVNRNIPPGERDTFESRYPFTMMIRLQTQYTVEQRISLESVYDDQYWKHNFQCIVGHKQTPDNEVSICVFGWDGSTFSDIVELSSSPIRSSIIIGLQVLGQGFDIYIVGGEYGENSGNFQNDIWRYSLISKSWFYVTRMPEPRRHMVVKFVNAKLLLAGGKGQSENDLLSVDVYDMDTGTWSKGSESTESFSNKSLVAVSPDDRILTFYNTGSTEIHTYNLQTNSWVVNKDFYFYNHSPVDDNDLRERFEEQQGERSVNDSEDDYWMSNIEREIKEDREFEALCDGMGIEYIEPKFLMIIKNRSYLLGSYKDIDALKIFNCQDFKTGRSSLRRNLGQASYDNQVNDGSFVFSFALTTDGTLCVKKDRFGHGPGVYKVKRPDIKDLCPEDPIGCFIVHNPKSLNELIVTP